VKRWIVWLAAMALLIVPVAGCPGEAAGGPPQIEKTTAAPFRHMQTGIRRPMATAGRHPMLAVRPAMNPVNPIRRPMREPVQGPMQKRIQVPVQRPMRKRARKPQPDPAPNRPFTIWTSRSGTRIVFWT